MDTQKLQVKLFASLAQGIAPELFINAFHRWVKERALAGELLLDVAVYSHVPEGPGIALIGHESDHFMDEEKGRLGLLYSRKRGAPAGDEALADAFRRALHAALLLEREPTLAGKLRFGGQELLFRINDRLAAPSSDATFAAWKPRLDALCSRLFGGAPFELARASSEKELFTVKIVTPAKQELGALLSRLGGSPPA
jgi:hypothetical protein